MVDFLKNSDLRVVLLDISFKFRFEFKMNKTLF